MYRYCPDKYKNKCGSCVNLDTNRPNGYKYPCSRTYGLHTLTESGCWRYELDENRDYDTLERSDRSDCYLTTVICEILGFEDDCEILSIMRSFRNNILQKDLRYLNILMQYDVVGPLIATNLKNDENGLWVAKELLKHYIRPIIKFIQNKNYDVAVVVYQNMTNLLIDNYALVDNSELTEDYDQSLGGHGRIYKKVNI